MSNAPVKLRPFAREQNISAKVLWTWIKTGILPEGVWIRSGRDYWIKPPAYQLWLENRLNSPEK